MPYNLRKRKAPTETVAEPAEKVRRPPKKVAKKDDIKEPTTKEEPEEIILEGEQDTKPASKKEVTKKLTKKDDTKGLKKDEPKRTTTKKAVSKKHPKQEEYQDIAVEEEPKVVPKVDTTFVVTLKTKVEETVTESNLLMFGADSCGELGLKKIGFSKKAPTVVPIGHRIKQVSCGPMHTIALTTEGQVYTFGCNDEGALGRLTEDEEEEATPTLVQLDHKIVKITTGDSHAAALSDTGKVIIWGNFRDERGPIGLLPECNGEKTYKPIQVMPEVEFKDIASGSNHMLLLDSDGIVYSFGVGEQGQLGRLSSEEMGVGDGGETKNVAITSENRNLFLKPQKVCLKNVDPSRPFVCDAVYAGNYSSFATNTDKKKNRLAGWGLNNYHQLGYKGAKNQIVQHFPKRSTFTCSTSMIQVSCGQHHTLFLTKNGRVYSAGRRDYGMLGLGEVKTETVCPASQVKEFDNPVVAIATGNHKSFALTSDGKVYSWGMNGQSLGVDGEEDLKYPKKIERLEGKKVVSISTGGDFTAVLVD